MGDAAPDGTASSTRTSPCASHNGNIEVNGQNSEAQVNSFKRTYSGRVLSDTGPPSGDPDTDSDGEAQYRSANEEETQLTPNEPSKPRKISLKKKAEQANFSQWLTSNRANLSKKTVNQPASQQAESLRYNIRSWQGGEKIIGQARDYQLELFERAKLNNTIAVLDTGEYIIFMPCFAI